MKKHIISVLMVFFLFPLFSAPLSAQEGVALSITPPLIKNSMNPGDIWKSSIKVINNNAKDLHIYIEAVDFRGRKEDGTVELLPSAPIGEEGEASPFLSQWIVLEENEAVLPAFGSKEIPFIVDVPENAAPGGHYAALLAGTRPPEEGGGGSVIKISSLLASLLLVNIKGDVDERGLIREFSSDKSFYAAPSVDFTVRFENLGNVHLQPLGEIKIYAPFNKLKETIALNHNSEFGNVLPDSIRKWNFHWSGQRNLLEMGRYRAELILGYGEEGRQALDQTIYFWVIYVKPLVIAFSVLFLLIILIALIIRSYVRRAIRSTQALLVRGIAPAPISAPKKKISVVSDNEVKKSGVIDLKK